MSSFVRLMQRLQNKSSGLQLNVQLRVKMKFTEAEEAALNIKKRKDGLFRSDCQTSQNQELDGGFTSSSATTAPCSTV